MEVGKKRDLIAIASIPLIMTLGNSMLIPILPAIRDKLGITSLQVSLMITVYSAVAIVLIPIAGYLSDRFGRKKIIIPSLIIAGAGGLVSGLGAWWVDSSYWIILAGRLLQGIGAAGAAPIVLPLVGDIFKQESDVSSGLGLVETANTFGKVLSPILGSALAALVWFLPFLAIPVFCLISILLVQFFVKVPKVEEEGGQQERVHARAEATESEVGNTRAMIDKTRTVTGKNTADTVATGGTKQVTESQETAGTALSFRQFLVLIKAIFKEKGRWLYAIFAIGCICMFVVFGVLFYLSEMLEEKYSVVGIVKGCILAIPLGALCLSSYIAGRAIGKNKKRMKWTTFIGLSLLTLAVGFCAMIQSIYLLVGMFCLAGIGIGAALPCLDALITEGIEKEQRGTITSIYSSMRFIGVAVGPPAASLLLNRSSQMMFYTIAATCLAAAILSLTAIRPKQSASGEKAA